MLACSSSSTTEYKKPKASKTGQHHSTSHFGLALSAKSCQETHTQPSECWCILCRLECCPETLISSHLFSIPSLQHLMVMSVNTALLFRCQFMQEQGNTHIQIDRNALTMPCFGDIKICLVFWDKSYSRLLLACWQANTHICMVFIYPKFNRYKIATGTVLHSHSILLRQAFLSVTQNAQVYHTSFAANLYANKLYAGPPMQCNA